MELFGALNRGEGRTILMVTHSSEAARYGTRAMRLENGVCTEGG